MTTLEKRVTDLERAQAGDGRLLVLFVHEPPTDDERQRVDFRIEIQRNACRINS